MREIETRAESSSVAGAGVPREGSKPAVLELAKTMNTTRNSGKTVSSGTDRQTTTDFRGNERPANCRECGERLLQGSIDIGAETCIPCSAHGRGGGS